MVILAAYCSQVLPHVHHLHAHDDHSHALEPDAGPVSSDPSQITHHHGDGHDHVSFVGLADRLRIRSLSRTPLTQIDKTGLHSEPAGERDSGSGSIGIVSVPVALPESIPIATVTSRGPPFLG